ETLVRHIDGELFGGGRDFYAFTLQVELTHARVEGKHVCAVAGAQHQQSGRTIQHIAGGDLFAAVLQVGGFVGRIVAGVGLQNGKDGADGDVDVNVGRTVQRVKQHQEFTVRVAGHRVSFFFAGHALNRLHGLQAVFDQVVGDHIHFFLTFALNVVLLGTAQHAGQ